MPYQPTPMTPSCSVRSFAAWAAPAQAAVPAERAPRNARRVVSMKSLLLRMCLELRNSQTRGVTARLPPSARCRQEARPGDRAIKRRQRARPPRVPGAEDRTVARSPACARRSMAKSSSSVNVASSPVPWTSTSRPAARHDDVHVHRGGRVLRVVQVEEHRSFHDSHAHRGHAVDQRKSCGIGQFAADRWTVRRPERSPPPVMPSVRVPPSASSTSQSTVIVRSPRASRSADRAQAAAHQTLDLHLVRPSSLPARSRGLRGRVLPGSMPYSAVIQPRPCPSIQGGTRGSTLAVHRSVVRPA